MDDRAIELLREVVDVIVGFDERDRELCNRIEEFLMCYDDAVKAIENRRSGIPIGCPFRL